MKTVVVTGATSGIGFAVSKTLVQRGYRVLAVGRTQENCKMAHELLLKEVANPDITYFFADLAQQREVNRVAGEISSHLDRFCGGGLYALVNNAGGIRNWYTTTEEGYEFQFALNHLAGFLLTCRLLPYLKKAGGRIILTGSNSHKHMKVHFKDIMYQKRYHCLYAYKQSKLCNMLFAAEFNRRFLQCGMNAYVVDPGLVCTDIGSKQTSGIVRLFWLLHKRGGVASKIPAETYAYLCDAKIAPDGFYYYLCKKQKYSKQADSAEAACRLFELSEKLCGITYGV
ncbi:MAG: SDR family NAD(P)-dependent oxidoreductase [Christensenellales bacterium]